MVGSLGIILGMRKRRWMVRAGSMINFVMWLFACLLYINNSYWYAFCAFGLVHVLAQGYFYLVSSVDMLWKERYT